MVSREVGPNADDGFKQKGAFIPQKTNRKQLDRLGPRVLKKQSKNPTRLT